MIIRYLAYFPANLLFVLLALTGSIKPRDFGAHREQRLAH